MIITFTILFAMTADLGLSDNKQPHTKTHLTSLNSWFRKDKHPTADFLNYFEYSILKIQRPLIVIWFVTFHWRFKFKKKPLRDTFWPSVRMYGINTKCIIFIIFATSGPPCNTNEYTCFQSFNGMSFLSR